MDGWGGETEREERFKGGEEAEVVVNGDGATEGRRKGLNVEQRETASERGRKETASQPIANL